MDNFDFLVIGGGISGLTYALEVADHGSVAVLFKGSVRESSTAWAQGGIAAVYGAEDNFDLHIDDTLKAGAGLCDREVVEIVVREGPSRVEELIARGANFDKVKDGQGYHLTREGGHSERRVLHSADATGIEIQRALLEAAEGHQNIQFFPHYSAIDLITTRKLGVDPHKENRVVGAYVLKEDGQVEPVVAKKILMATGGVGKVYLYTSNPDVATGDGIAMCFRAGASVANLEFFQFHPTCLYHPKARTFLITEALRGEGGILRRISGEPFMSRYHEQAELASRDIVARAIDHEMKARGEEYVLLDISHKESDFITERFPNIYQRCLSLGIDITTEPIPVVPAAHYCCGGVVTDHYGRSSLENLYVVGETAYSGLHGANRLASNSLLEGLVFSRRAAQNSVETLWSNSFDAEIPSWDAGSARNSDEEVVIVQTWNEIRRFMWNYVGIVRSDRRLERALSRSYGILREVDEYYWDFVVTPDLLELRNLSLVANLVIHSAIRRKESRGLHYNIDYPTLNDRFQNKTLLSPEEYFHFSAPYFKH